MNFEQSMIGRRVSPNGTDKGDRDFIKKDMGFDDATELKALSESEKNAVDASVAQVKRLIKENPNLQQAGYAQLLKLYPKDPRAAQWRELSK